MAANLSFAERLWRVLLPTPTQALGSVFLALALLTVTQTKPILTRLGISSEAITATGDQFHARFGTVLNSPIASNLALIVFWASVGLVAYLVCWGVYNIMIEARNEVTLSTTYTNRGHWRSPYYTLALKSVAGLVLASALSTLWTGFVLWLTLTGQAVDQPAVGTILPAVGAVFGLALQLYLVLIAVQLTFTPWYRAEG